MSIISEVIGGGAEGLLKGVGELAKDIRIAITGKDPVKIAEAEAKLLEMEFIAQKAQTDINLVEARNPNLFVSGWRPFIGWVCGVALAWQFLGHPIFIWAIKLSGSTLEPPKLDTDGLMGLVIAMLGMGSLRTYEKFKGVN